ncbi:hypothetical protein, partial [Leucothrix pacifica]|uniref:hypothetical protein n=1 Tax=Leucothrix pacifica TaxID=1247513 RepID=UPI001C63E33A
MEFLNNLFIVIPVNLVFYFGFLIEVSFSALKRQMQFMRKIALNQLERGGSQGNRLKPPKEIRHKGSFSESRYVQVPEQA